MVLPPDGARVGWQPSRFLADPTEAERTFQLAEQLGSINAAAAELGTTWPSLQSLPPPRPRHARRDPEAVRQRALAPASRRAGR
jgi:hypothetical protein